MSRRRVCYVTGTRAEFGLMRSVLEAIRTHPKLSLQLIVTGMHLSRAHGRTIDQIRKGGWTIDATVPWSGDLPVATARASAGIAQALSKLKPDVVLLCGDRVEPFAAASAAHLAGLPIAHVHGGDRALGQVDDALRHAISKLAHVHFCATRQSAERLFRMGEDRFRIHTVGTPGIDDARSLARAHPHAPIGAVVALHPESADERIEYSHAQMLLASLRRSGVTPITIVAPNNDPGWRGIARRWSEASREPDIAVARNLSRGDFLGRLASCAMLIGNSSAGIIEAASVGTPVVNVGDRQKGRQRSRNVTDVPWEAGKLARAVRKIWNTGAPKRYRGTNVYGGGHAGTRIARILSDLPIDARLLRKLIRY